MFKPPLGYIIKALGGFPVERDPRKKKESVVQQIIERIKKEDKIMFNIAPEGTRSKVNRLKSGFYRIAVDAGIKIVLVDFNYLTKTLHWDKAHTPAPTFEEELQIMKEFYKNSQGKYKEKSFDFSKK
jgi:1-acyl-sn-glycerol-3-phosphate acyltransferase